MYIKPQKGDKPVNATKIKRLSLHKTTISNLNDSEMSELYGGTKTTHITSCTYPSNGADCQTNIVYCETLPSFCYPYCI